MSREKLFTWGVRLSVAGCFLVLAAGAWGALFVLLTATGQGPKTAPTPPGIEQLAAGGAIVFAAGVGALLATGASSLFHLRRTPWAGSASNPPPVRANGFSFGGLISRVRRVALFDDTVRGELLSNRSALLEATAILDASLVSLALSVLVLLRTTESPLKVAAGALLAGSVAWVVTGLIVTGLGRFFGSALRLDDTLTRLGYAAAPLLLTEIVALLGLVIPIAGSFLPLVQFTTAVWALIAAMRGVYELMNIESIRTFIAVAAVPATLLALYVAQQFVIGPFLLPVAECEGFIDQVGACLPWDQVPPEVIRALGTPVSR